MSGNMDYKLMIKVSKLYFQEQMTKVEIAQKLHISRFKVARLLDMARNKGIVRIDIIDDEQDLSAMEEELEKKLKLDEVIIMQAHKNTSDAELKSILGQGAAKLFLETIQDNDVLGISWGATLSEVERAIPHKNSLKDLKIVQITGGMGQLSTIDGVKLVGNMAAKLNAQCSLLLTPVMVQTPEAKTILLQDNGISATRRLFENINVALTGIGSWYPELTSSLPEVGNMSQEDIELLKSKNVVADIFSHFVDINGNIVDGPLESRIMSIDVEAAQKIGFVIAVTGGIDRSMAIIGAARSGLINALVTDSCTAENVLKMIEQNS